MLRGRRPRLPQASQVTNNLTDNKPAPCLRELRGSNSSLLAFVGVHVGVLSQLSRIDPQYESPERCSKRASQLVEKLPCQDRICSNHVCTNYGEITEP